MICHIHQFGAEDSPQNAVNWTIQAIEAVEKLEFIAERCPIAPEDADIQQETRHLVIGDYRVLYRISGNTVQVLHVRHGNRDKRAYTPLLNTGAC